MFSQILLYFFITGVMIYSNPIRTLMKGMIGIFSIADTPASLALCGSKLWRVSNSIEFSQDDRVAIEDMMS